MLYVVWIAIHDGVTVDLRQMNRTTHSVKTKTALVARAKWEEVYTTLQAQKYFVPEAKASDVGAAGLIRRWNYLLRRSLWLCVRQCQKIEIVLGNGTVTNVNATHDPDLFKAIKADLEISALSPALTLSLSSVVICGGGRVTYNYAEVQKSFQPMIDWIDQTSFDPSRSVITFWGHNATSNKTLASNLYEYTGNATEKRYYDSFDYTVDPNVFPAPFPNFTFDNTGNPLPGEKFSRCRIPVHYHEPAQPSQWPPQHYFRLNIKATTPVLTHVNEVVQDVYESTYKDPPYTFLLAEYQYIPYIATQHSINNGGNVLCLDKVKDNVIVHILVALWDEPTQDTRVRELMDATVGNVTKYTQSATAYRPWQYVNYAY